MSIISQLKPISTCSTATGRVGTLRASREEITALLGAPNAYDAPAGRFDKISHEWCFRAPDGTEFSLYDYWWNGPDEYSIGGRSQRSAAWVRLIFGPAARLFEPLKVG